MYLILKKIVNLYLYSYSYLY